VIGRYRDTNAQTAIPNVTRPTAARIARRIFLRAIQSPVIASGPVQLDATVSREIAVGF
jgi:hypothetical protein